MILITVFVIVPCLSRVQNVTLDSDAAVSSVLF